MDIKITCTENETNVKVTGVINTETASQLETAFKEIDKSKNLTVDFAETDYITSAGLRALLVQRKIFSGDRMKVINVQEQVNDVFKVTGFDSIIPIILKENSETDFKGFSLKDLLACKAAHSAPRPAFIDRASGKSYSWEQINSFANAVAAELHGQGIQKGSHAGLMGTNSVDWIVTFFAIQKLGAIALLINPSLKPAEVQSLSKVGDITHLCYDSNVTGESEEEFLKAVTDSSLSEIKHTFNFSLRTQKLQTGEEPCKNSIPEIFVHSDDPAVVIFTSGSTGKPKAVLLSAYNLLNSADTFNKNYRITDGDISCLVLPLFHVFGLIRVLLGTALADGIIVLPKNIRSEEILNTVEQEKCTQLCSVPTLLLAVAANKDFSKERVASLKCIVMSGASAGEEQILRLQEAFPNAFFATNYGLSEMTPVSMTLYKDSVEHVSKTVGKPIENIQIKIADRESGREVPQGTSGEILVKGFNTMVCYYKLSIDDQPLDQDGFLHTGDLGLIDSDGYLRFVGRSKELIVRGGENIAPREIEEALLKHPCIDQVKVQGIPDDFYGEIAGACVILKEGMQFNEAEVREYLGACLAKYKIPAHFVLYESFPLLANGKIDAVNLKKDMNAKVLKK